MQLIGILCETGMENGIKEGRIWRGKEGDEEEVSGDHECEGCAEKR